MLIGVERVDLRETVVGEARRGPARPGEARRGPARTPLRAARERAGVPAGR
ncbi:hypothetical protein ACWD7B_30165 [Streptomyces rubiginosohelvolus]